MRVLPVIALSCSALVVVACLGAASGRWQGADIHLVDGTWIGTETACGSGDDDVECRAVVDAGLAAMPAAVRAKVTNAVVAALPTRFSTANGEVRTARLSIGIETRNAIVVDLVDHTRHVIGLLCHLPYASAGGLRVNDVRCTVDPLEWWLDGNAPPSYPPGTVFGQLTTPAGPSSGRR